MNAIRIGSIALVALVALVAAVAQPQLSNEELARKKAEAANQTEVPPFTLNLSPQERTAIQSLPMALAQCVGAVQLKLPDQICQDVAKMLAGLAGKTQ